MSAVPKTATRACQTDRRLYRSLAALIHEKDYESIVVKEILAHANVARSTFYAHFDGKEELLLGCMRYTLAATRERLPKSSDPFDQALGTCIGLLDHIEQHLEQTPVGKPHPSQGPVHRRLERVLVGQVEADLRRIRPERLAPDAPPELLAAHLVTAFFNVLEWWLRRRPAVGANEAKRMYLALVRPALVAGRER